MTGRRSHGRLSALNGVVHQGSDQVHQQDDRVAHRNILATTPRITKLDNLNGLRAE